MDYTRANTDWMADATFEASVHWTTKTMPERDAPGPFAAAVAAFDVARFADQLAETGADYLIFTPNHAEYFFPGPVAAVQQVMPSRAMERDLIGEIAAALHERGKRFLLYYNLRCDREWETAMGYFDPRSFDPFIRNLCSVVGGISEHYAGLLDGWWFDCGYCLDTRGEKGATAPFLEGKTFRFPWEDLTAAAKRGGEGILVAYASGRTQCDPTGDFFYTEHQDYWGGERMRSLTDAYPLAEVCVVPRSRTLPNGLQWHQWTCLDNLEWVHHRPDTPARDPLYSAEEICDFLRICHEKQAAMTFNVEIFRSGRMADQAVRLLATIKRRLGG